MLWLDWQRTATAQFAHLHRTDHPPDSSCILPTACLAAVPTPSCLARWRCWWPAACTSLPSQPSLCWWLERWWRGWSSLSTWAGGLDFVPHISAQTSRLTKHLQAVSRQGWQWLQACGCRVPACLPTCRPPSRMPTCQPWPRTAPVHPSAPAQAGQRLHTVAGHRPARNLLLCGEAVGEVTLLHFWWGRQRKQRGRGVE